jgi:hypothetical protein
MGSGWKASTSIAVQSAHVHLTEPSLDFFARVYLQCRGGAQPTAPMIVSMVAFAGYPKAVSADVSNACKR